MAREFLFYFNSGNIHKMLNKKASENVPMLPRIKKKSVQVGDPPCKPPLQTPPTLKHRSGASRRCSETNKISQRPRYSEMRLPAATRGFCMHDVNFHSKNFMLTFIVQIYFRKFKFKTSLTFFIQT